MAQLTCNEQLRIRNDVLKATNKELAKKVGSLNRQNEADRLAAEQRRLEETNALIKELNNANRIIEVQKNTIRKSAKWYNIFLKA